MRVHFLLSMPLLVTIFAACSSDDGDGGGASGAAGSSSGGTAGSGSGGTAGSGSGGTAGSGSGGTAGSAAGAAGAGGDPCSLPPDSGPCEAAFERWYHDPATGTCRTFTYGGCEGNANNFETQEACEAACVDEPACNLIDCMPGATCVYVEGHAVCAPPCASGGTCSNGLECTCGSSCPACKDCQQVCVAP